MLAAAQWVTAIGQPAQGVTLLLWAGPPAPQHLPRVLPGLEMCQCPWHSRRAWVRKEEFVPLAPAGNAQTSRNSRVIKAWFDSVCAPRVCVCVRRFWGAESSPKALGEVLSPRFFPALCLSFPSITSVRDPPWGNHRVV